MKRMLLLLLLVSFFLPNLHAEEAKHLQKDVQGVMRAVQVEDIGGSMDEVCVLFIEGRFLVYGLVIEEAWQCEEGEYRQNYQKLIDYNVFLRKQRTQLFPRGSEELKSLREEFGKQKFDKKVFYVQYEIEYEEDVGPFQPIEAFKGTWMNDLAQAMEEATDMVEGVEAMCTNVIRVKLLRNTKTDRVHSLFSLKELLFDQGTGDYNREALNSPPITLENHEKVAHDFVSAKGAIFEWGMENEKVAAREAIAKLSAALKKHISRVGTPLKFYSGNAELTEWYAIEITIVDKPNEEMLVVLAGGCA